MLRHTAAFRLPTLCKADKRTASHQLPRGDERIPNNKYIPNIPISSYSWDGVPPSPSRSLEVPKISLYVIQIYTEVAVKGQVADSSG